MKTYIDKDALLSAVNEFPAADVRPVVLCRDCKYYYKDADGYEMCDNSEGYDHVSAEGFCAWALRRDSKRTLTASRTSGKWERDTAGWDENGYVVWRCSECGRSFPYDKFNFCPNCGADMREVEE